MKREACTTVSPRFPPEGGYTVTVPTLPGCVTFGETGDEAITMAREAIELYIEGMLARGEEVPTEEGLPGRSSRLL
jgi:antitoxin HicB